MNATVHQFPNAAAARVVRTGLNMDPDEVIEASGGYKRPSDQLKALHARGFVRAHCGGPGGRVILERSHYEAVTRGQFGQAAANQAPAAHWSPPAPPPWEDTPMGRWQQARRDAKRALLAQQPPEPAVDPVEQAAHAAWWANHRMEKHAAVVRFHAAKRRAAKLKRTPPWADDDATKAIYVEARRLTVTTGVAHHVDHVIPMQGQMVSGLHVHTNLQILTGADNSRKKNRFEVTE